MDITKIILKMLSKLNKVTWIKFSKIGLVIGHLRKVNCIWICSVGCSEKMPFLIFYFPIGQKHAIGFIYSN